MFDRIAGVYDLMNSVMTAGLHHKWRRRAADLAAVGPGDRVLDVASGTGDLAIELARRVGVGGEVVGSDFSEEMLARARRKAPGIRFEWGNALELPYADDTLRRRDGRLRRAQLLRPRARPARDDARRAPRRQRRDPRDHDADAAAALDVLRASGSTGSCPLIGRLAGDPDAYEYLPRVRQALPGPARPRRGDGPAPG